MQEDRVNIRSSAELLQRALITNALANWAVAIAQLLTALVILYAWSS